MKNRGAERDNMRVDVTFDRSATPFMLKAFGYTPKRKYVYTAGGKRLRCMYCDDVLTLDTVAGFKKTADGPKVLCTKPSCIVNVAKGKKHG